MSRELLQQALGALGTSTWDHTRAVGKQELITALRAALAQPEPWQGAEEWESLAWELCADENGEDSCNELIWEGGPIKEPWGERWLKYEDEAKRLIALVRKHVAAPPAAPIDGFGGNLDEAFDVPSNQLSGNPGALTLIPPAVMVMVPREPTEAMCISGDKARHSVVTQARTSAIYRAMIAAAPAPAVPSEAALNTLARLFHNGEEIEGDDGAAMMVDMALWHEASEAFDSLIGEGDGETLASSAAPAVPLTDADIDRIADTVPVDDIGVHITTWHRRFARAVLSAAPAVPEELSPEFTDTARNALLWVLWHHQGGSSPVGQPVRFALGMGAHDRLNEHQIAQAKQWAATTGSTTAEFHTVSATPAVPLTDRTAQIVRPLPETMSRDEMLQHYSAHANLCAHEALQYQKRIRDLEKALSAAPAVPRSDEFACPYCFDQGAAPAVPVSWDRLRTLMDGIPTREEFIGDQRQQYVAKEAVMSWLHEGQLRAKREAVQPAAPTVQVVLRQPNLFASAPAVREPQDERAAFEAWIRKDSGDLTTFGSGSNMHYRNSAVNNAWTGWQARAHGIGGGGISPHDDAVNDWRLGGGK